MAQLGPDGYRWASVADMPAIPRPCTLDYISRLPLVSAGNTRPLPMNLVALLVPGYDPWRDAGPYRFVPERAELAVDFFSECLTHTKGEWAGQPLVLELWQQAVVGNLFGWVDAAGLRRYREVLWAVPRKNAKTTTCAGLATMFTFLDREPGAEVYCAAAEKGQAALLFDQARAMVQREPMLNDRARIYRALKSIEVPESGSVLRAISADAKTKHGFNTHAFFLDELHAQRDGNLLEALESSMGARRQPVGVHLTTRDAEGPSVCNEKWAYAQGVQVGSVHDPRFLPVLYEPTKGAKWESVATWRQCNPGYGVSVKPEDLEREATKAKESARARVAFQRFRLNMPTQASFAFFDVDRHDLCRQDYTLADLKGMECHGGLDLASVSDLASLVLWFPEVQRTLAVFWCPEAAVVRRSEKARVAYVEWARAGFIRQTEGDTIDDNRVVRDTLELAGVVNLRSLAYDRWNASSIVRRLVEGGVDCMPFGQGMQSMSGPMKELERLMLVGQAHHNGDPVLRWCVANVLGRMDEANNVKPDRKRSREKIDGAVAWIMALGATMLAGAQAKGSAYDRRGLRTL